MMFALHYEYSISAGICQDFFLRRMTEPKEEARPAAALRSRPLRGGRGVG